MLAGMRVLSAFQERMSKGWGSSPMSQLLTA